MNPLAITHYTLSSALGHGREAQWQALISDTSGLRRVSFDTNGIDCHLGEVAGLEAPLPATLKEWECRNHRLAWLALQQDGLADAVNALRARHGARRIGVFIGTSTAGIHATELAFRECAVSGRTQLPDWFDYRHTQNLSSVADFVATALQLTGHTLAISTACSSSAKVFAAARRSLQLGLCDAAIVGGVDSLCLTTLYGFNSLQLVSPEPCRPADAARKGISIGEAAGFAILDPHGESATSLLGYGESGDAHHMSSPDPLGQGAAAAMRAALVMGRVAPEQVDYINLHGTGTPANDAAEDQGVFSVFGDTPCSSTKGWTGHTLGAAGIMEAGLALMCIEQGLLPRSLNTVNKDPTFRSQVLLETRRATVRRVMSNSFGFGGSNCCLLLGASA